jgi:hypothetical protein
MSGDISGFETFGAPAFLRAVLPVRALALPASHPLTFADGAWLVQLSRATTLSGAFESHKLLVQGCFLIKPGTLKKTDFTQVGRLPVIEFPWFLADQSSQGLFVCRGELTSQPPALTQPRPNAWDVRLLTLSFPQTLQGDPGDIRHSTARDDIVRTLELDLDEPYLDAVRRVSGEARIAIYAEAVGQASIG